MFSTSKSVSPSSSLRNKIFAVSVSVGIVAAVGGSIAVESLTGFCGFGLAATAVFQRLEAMDKTAEEHRSPTLFVIVSDMPSPNRFVSKVTSSHRLGRCL